MKTDSLSTLKKAHIERALSEKLASGKEFSAYDVLTLLRTKGFYADRATVNPVVHDIMLKNTKYLRVDNGTFIQYIPRTSCTRSIKSVDAKGTVSTTPAVKQPNTDTVICDITYDYISGRINIPSSILSILGYFSGDIVSAVHGTYIITILHKRSVISGSNVKTYTSDHHNNLRIRFRNFHGKDLVAKTASHGNVIICDK